MSITEQKLREMEAEMSRFEDEILKETDTKQKPVSNVSNASLKKTNSSSCPPPPLPPNVLNNKPPSFVPPQIRFRNGNHAPSNPQQQSFPPMQMPPRPPIINSPTLRPRYTKPSEEFNRGYISRSVFEPTAVIMKPPQITRTSNSSDVKKNSKKKASESIGADASVEKPAKVIIEKPKIKTKSQVAVKSVSSLPQVKTTCIGPAIVPEMASGSEATAHGKKDKKRKFMRMAAGEVWEDLSLQEWDQDDFRMFAGDLGNEVTDDMLIRVFNQYPSFVKAKVIRDKRTNKTKGYGFISFRDPDDFVKAMRDLNGKYVGNRPIKLRRSNWQERQIDVVRRKEKEKKKMGLR